MLHWSFGGVHGTCTFCRRPFQSQLSSKYHQFNVHSHDSPVTLTHHMTPMKHSHPSKRTRQHQPRKEIVWLYMVRYTMMHHQDAIDSSIACGERILHIELQGLGDPMTHGPRTLNGHEQDESVSESERESESDTLPIIFNTRTNRRTRHNRVEAVP